ncbi:MAG: sigma-54 dependent transcriptional regulator [Rickettsiales bacterium]
MNNTILIVDDEEDIRDLVSDILTDEGYQCCTAANSVEAFAEIEKNKPSIVLLDIWLQGSDLDGLGILEVIKEKYPFIPVIMISGHGTIETAVTSIRYGAYDYIEKPFTPEKLNITVKRASEASRLKRENIELKKKIASKPELIGESNAIQQLKINIEKVSTTSSRVLIKGEYGSGKELAAKLVHKLSDKRNYPFVTINGSVINNTKVKNDLLGDPSVKKFGVAELVAKGTLYIDNISELPLDTQKNILKFVQGNKDSQSSTKYNVRVIGSISENPNEAIKSGRLFKDLYNRINVVSLSVPSLKERKEDIEHLSRFFMKNIAKSEGFAPKEITKEVIANLQAMDWPGNIRELENFLEKLFIIANIRKLHTISLDLLEEIKEQNGKAKSSQNLYGDIDFMSLSLRQAREEFERHYLASQMSRFNNNISKTSVFVGMERSALHRKLKMLNIHGSNNPDSESKESTSEEEMA